MIDISRILCPVDFSAFSERAFEHAVAIARWYKSTITLLHVLDVRLETPVGPPLAPIALAPAPPAIAAQEQIISELQKLVAASAATDCTIDKIVRDGRTDGVILEMAAALPADLLVMGTHGRSGFDRLVMGSVTERVPAKGRVPGAVRAASQSRRHATTRRVEIHTVPR